MNVCAGVLLDWVTFHGHSVWPAVIGHAAINGIGGLSLLFVQGTPLALLGRAPIGVIGSERVVLDDPPIARLLFRDTRIAWL